MIGWAVGHLVQPHLSIANVLIAGGQLRCRQLQRHGVDVQPLDDVLNPQLLEPGEALFIRAQFSSAAFHVRQDGSQQRTAAAGEVNGFVLPPDRLGGPVRVAAGIQSEPGPPAQRPGAA